MDFLGRDSSGLSNDIWQEIDAIVTHTAKTNLVARRVLPFTGSLGAGTQVIISDSIQKEELALGGYQKITERKLLEVPELYEDFTLYWRDLEYSEHQTQPADLSAAATAAQLLCSREDSMVFYGAKAFGIDGIFTANGSQSVKKTDWASDENAYMDIATGLTMLAQNSCIGRYELILSPDNYLKLQRIQPNTGMLEIERIEKLLSHKIHMSLALKENTAVLLCAEKQHMDLVVGQDIRTAFLETTNMNYQLRIMETAVLRIKNPKAIIIYQ